MPIKTDLENAGRVLGKYGLSVRPASHGLFHVIQRNGRAFGFLMDHEVITLAGLLDEVHFEAFARGEEQLRLGSPS